MFEKFTCKMVRGEMVLMRGIKIGTLYKLLGRIEKSNYFPTVYLKTDKILSCVANLTMLWHQ